MDLKDLSAKASARCGIRIEPHDPAFVLITLNQLVLEETVAAICIQVDTRIASIAESIQNVERLAGKTLAQEIRASGIEVGRGIQDDVKQAGWQARELILQVSRSSSRPALIRWAAMGVLGGILNVCRRCLFWLVCALNIGVRIEVIAMRFLYLPSLVTGPRTLSSISGVLGSDDVFLFYCFIRN